MGVHDGHRERLKARFLHEGLNGFEEHAVLEILLFYTIPRVDTNPLAHVLLNKFGSLSAVFDAPYEDLLKVSGIGPASASMIKLIPSVCRRYMISRNGIGKILTNTKEIGNFIMPYFFGETDEVVYLICLDGKNKVLDCSEMGRGSLNYVSVNTRKIVGQAMALNAASVIIAHNHPGGLAVPSFDDVEVSQKLKVGLEGVGIFMIDHIIVADGDFVSLNESMFLNDKKYE